MIKFAMIFPGHGFQNLKIMKKLYKNYSIIKKTFKEASYFLNYNLWNIFIKNRHKKKNRFPSQLEILTISISLYRLWKKKIGIHPYVMTGHSLGQYSALVCSNVLKFSDALKIVSYREKLMRKKKGVMYAIIGLKKKTIEKILENYKKKIFIACINSQNQIIITGKKKYFPKIHKQLKKKGAKHIINLPIKNLSHCFLMKNIKKKIINKFFKINFFKPKNLILDSVLVNFLKKPKKIKYALFNQICKPVDWNNTINFLISKDIKYFLEMNTGNMLTKLNIHHKKYYPLYIKKFLI